jgi:hypothetical protein
LARRSSALRCRKRKGGKNMKCFAVLLITTALFFSGCKYEKPLVEEHTIPIDASVLGLWEPLPSEGDNSGDEERLLILKFSDTEYLIHYPPGGNDEMYYRGYPIKIGGIPCIQLQIIGTKDGLLRKDFKYFFVVVSYELNNKILEIKTLNSYMVDEDLKTTKTLKQAFLKHKDDKNLFTNPVRFKQLNVKN